VIERTLAKRYAAALLEVTDAEGSTEETETVLLALREAYRSDRKFRALLGSPRVPRRAKKELFHKILAGKAKPSLVDFLDLLVDKNRIDLLPDVSELFDRLADASHGIVRARVLSWKPLSDAHRATLTEKLARMTGKKVAIEAETDASLKGGMLVRIGDSIIDGSVAHRLKVLGRRFRELERR